MYYTYTEGHNMGGCNTLYSILYPSQMKLLEECNIILVCEEHCEACQTGGGGGSLGGMLPPPGKFVSATKLLKVFSALYFYTDIEI